MKTILREFEINRYKANAFCPCNKSNKSGKFATEKGFVGKPVGHCFSCDKDFWNDDKSIIEVSSSDRQTAPLPICNQLWKDLESSFDINLQSGFAKFLVKTFGEDEAVKAVEKYFLGVYDQHSMLDHTSDKNVIFWQVDREDNVRAGKIMAYFSNGKRNRFANKTKLWTHESGKCQLRQCFFGDHLIPDNDLPIAVCESAKTAVVMDICNPSYIWLSAESLGGLSFEKCESIKDFDVTLYPDQGAYDQWNEKAEKYDFQISKDCEFWYKAGIIKEKEDIADYYLNKHSLTDYEIVKTDPDWESFVLDNPHLNLDL